MRSPDNLLFHAVRNRKFGGDTCFLCGRKLGTKNRADEHVIPAWVQHRFELWDQRLRLLNGSQIPYRQLKIPCCADCNSVHLSKVEACVRAAVEGGPEHVAHLNAITLFLWLGKIFYGLLYKEFFLPLDRKCPRRGRIVNRTLLRRFDLHHLFLQAVRVPLDFGDSFPASIFVFSTQAPKDPKLQFDLTDWLDGLTISIRMGAVGILAALQDGGAQRTTHADDLYAYQTIDLHPLQFAELTAAFFYKASLMNRVPKYIVIEAKGRVLVCQSPLGGFTTEPLFDSWDNTVYARFLSQFTRFPLQDVLRPSGEFATWLHDDSGKVRFVDVASNPWWRSPSG